MDSAGSKTELKARSTIIQFSGLNFDSEIHDSDRSISEIARIRHGPGSLTFTTISSPLNDVLISAWPYLPYRRRSSRPALLPTGAGLRAMGVCGAQDRRRRLRALLLRVEQSGTYLALSMDCNIAAAMLEFPSRAARTGIIAPYFGNLSAIGRPSSNCHPTLLREVTINCSHAC